MGAEATPLTRSTTDKKRPRWSGRGDRIVYQTNNGEIFMINADGTGEQQVGAELGIAIDPAWSPDDQALFLSVFRSGLREDSEIWQVPLAQGAVPKRLTSKVGLQYSPAPSPDGKWLVYVSGAGEASHELWRLEVKTSQMLQLTTNRAFDIAPRWSPDGGSIAFASNRSGNYDIWVIDAAGKNERQLTNNQSFEINPAWSRDGKWIAFESNRDGPIQIWIMPSTGGKPARISPPELDCRNPDWGPAI